MSRIVRQDQVGRTSLDVVVGDPSVARREDDRLVLDGAVLEGPARAELGRGVDKRPVGRAVRRLVDPGSDLGARGVTWGKAGAARRVE